jgi:hypothetical protein
LAERKKENSAKKQGASDINIKQEEYFEKIMPSTKAISPVSSMKGSSYLITAHAND